MCVCPEGTLVSTIFQFLETCVCCKTMKKVLVGNKRIWGKMMEKSSFVCFFFPVCLKHAEMN